jgi:hypothetical protein
MQNEMTSKTTVHKHLTDTLPDVVAIDARGETSYFFNPWHLLKRDANLSEKTGNNKLHKPQVTERGRALRKAS